MSTDAEIRQSREHIGEQVALGHGKAGLEAMYAVNCSQLAMGLRPLVRSTHGG